MADRHGPGRGRPFHLAVGHRGPRHQPDAGHRQVLVPTGQVEVPDRAALTGVLDHHDPPALAVAAAGGEPGGVQDAIQHVVGHRIRQEVTHCAGGAKGLGQIHGAAAYDPDRDRPGERAGSGDGRARGRPGPAHRRLGPGRHRQVDPAGRHRRSRPRPRLPGADRTGAAAGDRAVLRPGHRGVGRVRGVAPLGTGRGAGAEPARPGPVVPHRPAAAGGGRPRPGQDPPVRRRRPPARTSDRRPAGAAGGGRRTGGRRRHPRPARLSHRGTAGPALHTGGDPAHRRPPGRRPAAGRRRGGDRDRARPAHAAGSGPAGRDRVSRCGPGSARRHRTSGRRRAVVHHRPGSPGSRDRRADRAAGGARPGAGPDQPPAAG